MSVCRPCGAQKLSLYGLCSGSLQRRDSKGQRQIRGIDSHGIIVLGYFDAVWFAGAPFCSQEMQVRSILIALRDLFWSASICRDMRL